MICSVYFNFFYTSIVNLAPSVKNLTRNWLVSPHLTRYHSNGFVIFNEKGDIGKLCTENLNRSLSPNKTMLVLQTVAASLCRTLSYKYGCIVYRIIFLTFFLKESIGSSRGNRYGKWNTLCQHEGPYSCRN